MESLYKKLEKYCENADVYPFHMPGHKRNLLLFDKSYSIDITEINSFDDLNHPNGIFKQAMDEMSEFYNTDRTFMLINGSTVGILASIFAVCQPNDKILVARNCHKSVYNAIMLRQLNPVYVFPAGLENNSFSGSVTSLEIEKALDENPDIKACVIVSPTYEGVVSDIKSIAEVLHSKNIPLIVDEAHGAHLPFSSQKNLSAINCGADITIQSLHKTLPALTQCGLVHVKSDILNHNTIQTYLSIFQTSSPSYILSSSIIECFHYMKENAFNIYSDFTELLDFYRDKISNLSNIYLYDGYGAFAYDKSKLVISSDRTTGIELMDKLRGHKIECEMCCYDYVTAIATVCDTEDGFKRLYNALCSIDKSLHDCKSSIHKNNISGYQPTIKMSPYSASILSSNKLLYSLTLGKISAETVYLYPPGIPIICAGEEISQSVISVMEFYEKNDLEIKGDIHEKGYLSCI